MIITYTNDNRSLKFTYDDDLAEADFLAVGIDATDALIIAAMDAEGCDFTHDGNLWTSHLS